MIAKALSSSTDQNHESPDMVLKLVRKLGRIGLDPCTTKANPTKARRFYTPDTDGMLQSWQALGLVYINPPYGNGKPKRRRKPTGKRRATARKPWQHTILEWAAKVVNETAGGAEVLWLGPGRTDTEWFDLLCRNATARCEWKGRLTFKGSTASAPFPSTLFYFGPRPWLFCHVFAPHGRVEVLRAHH